MRTVDVIRRSGVGVEGGTTLRAAAQLMDDSGVGALVVLDGDAIAGIATDRDLVRRGLARGLSSDARIDSVMSTPVVTIDASADAHDAYAILRTSPIRRLVVVDRGRFVGMVSIDDLLIEHPEWAPERPAVGIAPKLTDAELVTLAVLQALLGYANEARFIRHAHAHLRPWFPYLPDRPGYNKRLRRAGVLMQHVCAHLARACPSWHDDLWLVDSTPVECGRSRETTKRSDLAGWATYGYCASHSRFFWGLRLHLITTPSGLPIAFALTGAKTDERDTALDMLAADPDLRIQLVERIEDADFAIVDDLSTIGSGACTSAGIARKIVIVEDGPADLTIGLSRDPAGDGFKHFPVFDCSCLCTIEINEMEPC